MKNNKLIPAAATVTLPASEYYALIKLTNNLINDRDIQLDGVKIAWRDGRVNIDHSEIKPYAKPLAEHVATLLSKDDEAMDLLVDSNQYCYSPYNNWLNDYSWDIDLRKYKDFAKAWESAEARVKTKEANDESEA